ncbi:MAG: DUF4294 domain-containing protein [Prevotellaceae bacterium]|nr:DUF4294 domain-containing protein [Prevotellaceae bacterium]
MRKTVTLLLMLLGFATAFAQTEDDDGVQAADIDDPAFVPTVKVSKVVDQGDSIPYMEMSNVYVYPQLQFGNKKQMSAYLRLVRNVKKVLPIAKEANHIIVETYDYLQTLPDKKARDEHLKLVEKSIVRDYKPKMKNLTYSQGKLLIKLVYRECDSSSYDIVKAVLGPVRAGFWQAFAWCFGASLKKGYDPEGTDRLTERVVLMVEAGQL